MHREGGSELLCNPRDMAQVLGAGGELEVTGVVLVLVRLGERDRQVVVRLWRTRVCCLAWM